MGTVMGVPAGYDAVLTDARARDGVQARGPAHSVSRLRVGRVGALAAALGIGAAMFAIPGLATADTGGSGGASGSVSSSGSLSSGSRGPADVSSRTARESSTPADGVPGNSAAEAVAGRDVGTGRRASATKGLPNSIAPEAEPRRGARSAGQSAVGGGASAPAKSTNNASPVEVPPAVATTRSATTTASAATVPAVSAAAVPQVSSGNAGAAAVAIRPARVGWAPAVVAATPASPVPFAGLPANGLFAQLVQRIDAQNQAAVRTIFHALLNWTSTLPVNPLTTWLEGGLLIVRKSLFNQTAGVRSVQSANSPALVIGKIDVVDPEGDAWKVELVSDPSHGTVEIGTTSQANGIGSTKYTYTPGEGYAGGDQFVVKVTPTEPVFNILHPFGVLNTRYYTVAVGDAAEAATIRFNADGADPKDVLDTHLFLSNAAATVKVRKQGLLNPKYTVTMTLSAETAAKSFATMDIRGNISAVPLDTMLGEDWQAYAKKAAENGVKPLLVLKYSDGGVDKAILAGISNVTKNADGTHTLSGQLMSDTPAQDGRVDSWDFIGAKYEKPYEDFIKGAGLADCKAGQQCASISVVGKLAITTLSPSAFTETGGRDYGTPPVQGASATQTAPGAMGPGTAPGNGTEQFGSTNSQDVELTAMIPWGTTGSFISATNLTQGNTEGTPNGIFLNTATAPASGGSTTWTRTQLVDNQWNAAVNVMARYDQVLLDDNGKPVATTLAGTVIAAQPARSYSVVLDAASSAIGSSLQLSEAALAAAGVSDPGSLLGATVVNDAWLPPGGSVITAYSGVSGGTANYTLPGNNGFGTGVTLTVNAPATANFVKLAVPGGVDPGSLIDQTITGLGIPDNTTITGFVSSDITGVIYSVSSSIRIVTPSTVATSIAVTLPDIPALQPGLVVGLSDGSVYYWNGHACAKPSCTAPTVDYANPAVIQTDNPGLNPVSIAIGPNGTLYAAGEFLQVIDTKKNEISGSITAPWLNGSFPSVAVNPNGVYAYATSGVLPGNTQGIVVVATATNIVQTSISLPDGASANAVAISPDGDFGYIASASGAPSVYQFDANTNALVGPPIALPAGDYVRTGMAVSGDGAYLYVSNAANGTVSVIDTTTNSLLPDSITVGGNPGAMAVSPDGQYLIVTQVPNNNPNSVSVIDTTTNTVTTQITVGNGPAGVAFNPVASASRAYVTNSNDSTMSIIDTQNWTVISTVPTGAGGDDTLGVAITPDGANVYLANFSGGGDSKGTVPTFQVGTPVPKEWVQLQAGNGWGNGVAVNTITALADNSGFAVGLSDGQVGVWTNPIKLDGTILPGPSAQPDAGCSNGNNGNCWFTFGSSVGGVNAVIASGEGLVAVANAFNVALIEIWDGKGYGSENISGSIYPGSDATTLLPYDGTTLVGSIGGTALWADTTTGAINPYYPLQLAGSQAYLASSASCSPSAANAGVGCSGYVLTVQQAAGNSIRLGQTLYGGAGLLPGTVITQQISDGYGNLCSVACNTGGTGVYLVNTSQLVAPGTPMSASDGTGFIVGFNDGLVVQFGYPGTGSGGGRSEVQLNSGVNWGSAVNTMIPWRDGLALGLNNGAVMYWSPSNNTNSGLDYQWSTVTPQATAPAQPASWSQLMGYTDNCDCGVPFGSPVSSMVQMGDGFAVGLASGEVWGFNGFGPVSTTSAFGFTSDGTAVPYDRLGSVVPSDSVALVAGNLLNSPVTMALAPNGNLYAFGDTFTVVDIATNTITASLPIARPGAVPQVVVSPNGLLAYATAYLGNDTAGLAVVDTTQNTVLSTMALPQYTNADAVAISPDNTYGYIASGSNGSIYRFSTSAQPTSVAPVLTGSPLALPGASPNPGYAGLAFSQGGGTLYVSYAQNGNVYVVDTATNTIKSTINLGGSPGAMTVSPDGKSLLVAQSPNVDSNSVWVINTSTNTLDTTISVGNGPFGVAFNPNPGLPYAYVTNSNDSTVSIIDTSTWTVTGTFASGAGNDDTLGIVVTPEGSQVYLANYDGGGNSDVTIPVFQVSGEVPAVYVFRQMATSTTLGGGPNDSVQQLIPVTQLALDSSGNPVLASSVLAGLTNNAIYDWDGTNQWTGTDPTDSASQTWQQLQPSGDASISTEILEEAWAFGQTAASAWAYDSKGNLTNPNGLGAPYKSADGKKPATGDPLFSLPENLPSGCGATCQGDYIPIVYYKPLGDDGVIYSIGDNPGIQGNLNLSLLGLGYVFVPGGFVDKFEPDSYTASVLLAVQGGPSVVLTVPDSGLYTASDKLTGPSWSDTQETEVGIFSETVGINASLSAKVGLSNKPLKQPLTLASAYFTPGLLVSWNTNNYQTQMGVTYSSFSSTYVITAKEIEKYFDSSKADANLSVTATPYAKLTYGLFTPPGYPSLDIVSLSVGYENPVTATLNVPLNNLPSSIEDSTLKLTSSGVLTVSAGILPSLTKSLSWSDKFKVYSVSDTFSPLKDL